MKSMDKNYNPYDTFYRMINKQRKDSVEMMIFYTGYLYDFIIQHFSSLISRTKESNFISRC